MIDNHEHELTARIIELERQRNNALTDCVLKSGQLALAGEQICKLQEQIKELEGELKALN